MSDSLEVLLSQWGFTEYIDEFVQFGLDNKTIFYLTDQQLDRIFDGNLGKQIRFKLSIYEYIKENNIELIAVPNSEASLITKLVGTVRTTIDQSLEKFTKKASAGIDNVPAENVAKWLESVVEKPAITIASNSPANIGKRSISDVETSSTLYKNQDFNIDIISSLIKPYRNARIKNEQFETNADRTEFVKDLFKYCSQSDIYLSTPNMRMIAALIPKVLVNEKSDYYYYHDNGKRGGKLYYKKDYSNRTSKGMKKLKSCNLTEEINTLDCIHEADKSDQETTSVEASEKKTLVLEKIAMSCGDLTKEEWNITLLDREKEIKGIKCATDAVIFFKKWPIYKNMCTYVKWDYDLMYPKDSKSIIVEWENFVHVIVPYLHANVRDKETKKRMKKLSRIQSLINNREKIITTNEENYEILMSLHALVPPTKCSKTKTKEVWKYSIFDSQNASLRFYKTVAERDEDVLQMVQKNKKYGLTTGLYMTMIGEDLNTAQIQVTYDEITYLFNNILYAADCAFKVIMVFGLSYQPQSYNFWQLFQGCFSETILEGKISPQIKDHVKVIMNQIKDLKEKTDI